MANPYYKKESGCSTLDVRGHDVDGAGDGHDDDDEPEEAGQRPDAFVLPAPAVETPAVETRRLAELGEQFGPQALALLWLYFMVSLWP